MDDIYIVINTLSPFCATMKSVYANTTPDARYKTWFEINDNKRRNSFTYRELATTTVIQFQNVSLYEGVTAVWCLPCNSYRVIFRRTLIRNDLWCRWYCKWAKIHWIWKRMSQGGNECKYVIKCRFMLIKGWHSGYVNMLQERQKADQFRRLHTPQHLFILFHSTDTVTNILQFSF